MVWTTGEIETLRTYAHLGAKRLSDMLPGRKVNSIYSKASSEKIPLGRTWTEEDESILMECVHDGVYDWERLNVMLPHRDERAIRRRYQRISGKGLKHGRPNGSKEYDYDHIRELHKSGLSKEVISTRVGCSTRTIKRAIYGR